MVSTLKEGIIVRLNKDSETLHCPVCGDLEHIIGCLDDYADGWFEITQIDWGDDTIFLSSMDKQKHVWVIKDWVTTAFENKIIWR